MFPAGTERIKNAALCLEHDTVEDFWRWAFGDLKANNVRGVFAEWMVGRILGLPRPDLPRDSWAECDLKTEDGFRIEIKAGAYLQTWEQKAPSRVVFSGLKGQTWNPTDACSGTATYNADLYVFCVHTEKDPAKWDALDLDQWRFYVLTRQEVEATGQRSLALSVLEKTATALTAAELRTRAGAIMRQWRAARPAGPPQA